MKKDRKRKNVIQLFKYSRMSKYKSMNPSKCVIDEMLPSNGTSRGMGNER